MLVAYGAQDTYLTGGNPEINHFKYVARTHVHHAKEPVELYTEGYSGPPDRTRVLELRFPITRVGDLLHSANLLFTLPGIRVPDPKDAPGYSQVRWVSRPGLAIINEARVIVGGTEVQTMDRERMLAAYNTDLRDEERALYDQMIGNTQSLTNPAEGPLRRFNATTDPSGNTSSYPYATTKDEYTLPETRLRVPLLFWFTRSITESLPVGFLTRHECEIIIRLRPWSQLLQVRNSETDTWEAPPSTFRILDYISAASGSAWEPNPILEGVYYFLNDEERNRMAREEIRVPVLQLRRYDETTAQTRGYFAAGVESQTNTDVQLSSVTFRIRQESNPVSRLFVMARRDDFTERNDWTRLGNWEDSQVGRDASDVLYPYTDPIIQDFTLRFNGNEVLEEIPREYLTLFDPYKHSRGRGHPGIACYSFGIQNRTDATSGTANFGRIRDPLVTVNVTPSSVAPSGYNVILLVESVNWFRYSAGFAGLMYAT